MIMKLIAFAFLFTVAVNGHESSLAASQARVDTQLTEGRSDSGQSSLMAMLVGFLRPADVQHHQRDNEVGSYLHKVDNDDQSPAASATPITPMTSITIDPPQSQPVDADQEKMEVDREKARLEQLQQQLTAKEKELTLLLEKTAATTNQLTVEKTRAEALEAQ